MNIFQHKKIFLIIISLIILATVFFYYQNMENKGKQVQADDFLEKEMLQLQPDTVKANPDSAKQEGENLQVIIDLKGAVINPGVYEMNDGERVHQLIKKAGGLTNDANELAVNLAAPLEDGMVVYIPKEGEETETLVTKESMLTNEGRKSKVNINKAAPEELQSLTGIGPSKAEAIVAFREENGPFTKIEDIMEVTGIGQKSFEKIKEEIVTN